MGNVDNAAAFGIAGASEKGAESAVAQGHFSFARGAGLFPIEGRIVVFFFEVERFDGCCKCAGGIIGAAVKIFAAGPDFL